MSDPLFEVVRAGTDDVIGTINVLDGGPDAYAVTNYLFTPETLDEDDSVSLAMFELMGATSLDSIPCRNGLYEVRRFKAS